LGYSAKNNESVKTKMASVPIVLTIIQGCIFAPVIEKMTFRFSEFFYYLLPSLILTIFYTRYRNVFASIMLHSAINIVGYIGLIVAIVWGGGGIYMLMLFSVLYKD